MPRVKTTVKMNVSIPIMTRGFTSAQKMPNDMFL